MGVRIESHTEGKTGDENGSWMDAESWEWGLGCSLQMRIENSTWFVASDDVRELYQSYNWK